MLLDILPQRRVLLDADLGGAFVNKLTKAAEVHGLSKEGDDIFVKGLPVRVVEVVLLALFYCQLCGDVSVVIRTENTPR